ncbi:MAG TPA: FAD-dependent oxidoreductase [Candidatus Cybelea sp.]|jgi:2-polyprenyl-6-methoxyphenol hydroxylase-like FAD-dependent oxidoreductase
MSEPQRISTEVCIVGGGPCGVLLGVLLARTGVDVVVLEKYPDFFRDFRGDTIHPSTLELLFELGWLDEFLKLPHQELSEIGANIAGENVQIADFTHLHTRCKFLALMPQWDFLNFFAERGNRYPTFHLMMKTAGTALIERDARTVGARAVGPDREIEIDAKLVVGADGRHSTVRTLAGLIVDDLGAPMDVVWMRLSKHPGETTQRLGMVTTGHLLVTLDRGEYWQCAYIIAKGSLDELKTKGIEALQQSIVQVAPQFADRVAELDDWSKVSVLEVRVDRLRTWHKPGLLCIGDSAHAMSPVGGVGINLAIQDAVATSNILADTLRAGGTPSDEELARVQDRRMFPTKVTQEFQIFIQNRGIDPLLRGAEVTHPSLATRLLDEVALLRRIPARLIGVGIRPEHIRTRDAFASGKL